MPKAILEFQLPEEQSEYNCANRGAVYLSAITTVRELIRARLKHEAPSADEVEFLERIRQAIYEELETND